MVFTVAEFDAQKGVQHVSYALMGTVARAQLRLDLLIWGMINSAL
jgi:hypothetical protein